MGTVIYAAVSYLFMCLAFFLPKQRTVHVSIMATVILGDVLFPFYLVMSKDWYKRLIIQEEIFSFMIWMHVLIVITLYMLYFFQVRAGLKMLRGEGDTQTSADHRMQGIGLLITRGLILVTGALLVAPDDSNM